MDLVDILLLDFAFQVDVSDVNYGVSFGKTVDRRGELDEGNEGLIIQIFNDFKEKMLVVVDGLDKLWMHYFIILLE